jgi:hypothetical protein
MLAFRDVGRSGLGELLQECGEERREHVIAAPLRELNLLRDWRRFGANARHECECRAAAEGDGNPTKVRRGSNNAGRSSWTVKLLLLVDADVIYFKLLHERLTRKHWCWCCR